MTAVPEIDVVIVNYNGANTLLKTVESLNNQVGVNTHITIVDDGSEDDSLALVRAEYNSVRIIEYPNNTREVNNLRNTGIIEGRHEYVFITDNDLLFQKDCLYQLYVEMSDSDLVSMCIPTLLYWDDNQKQSDKIYAVGSNIHYVGATTDSFRGASLKNYQDVIFNKQGKMSRYRNAIGGGIGLIRRDVLIKVGLFDEDYSLAWGDDGELHYRMLLAGYEVRCLLDACCLHEEKDFSDIRSYRGTGQVRNRILFVSSHYAIRTLILIFPMLLLHEFVQLVFMLMKGLPKQYFKGISSGLMLLPTLREKRQTIQSLRRRSDSDLLTSGPIAVAPTTSGGSQIVARLSFGLSSIYSAYWTIVKPLLGNYNNSSEETIQ